MKTNLPAFLFLFIGLSANAQNGWKVCNAPAFSGRVDDIFMVNTKTGYAAGGGGFIVKTTDGGENWTTLLNGNSVICRSVEFINEQKAKQLLITKGTKSALQEFILLQIKATPKTVAKPIDIIEITSKGEKWISRKQVCN